MAKKRGLLRRIDRAIRSLELGFINALEVNLV